MKLSMIVAYDKNRVIGKDNAIPWKLPRDMAYFREITMGCPIIMGRKNHESIGRPLPGRKNIVLTRDESYRAPGCDIAHTEQQALALAAGEQEAFVIGGEEIYRLFLPLADKLYITTIDHAFAGDTYFPAWDLAQWTEVSAVQGITDEHNPYAYVFRVYERVKETSV